MILYSKTMKYISIFGDSLSTFEGYNSEGYSYFAKDSQILYYEKGSLWKGKST